MKEFRIVRVMDWAYNLKSKGIKDIKIREKKFKGNWLNCEKYSINDLITIMVFNNQSKIKTWYLEYRG